MRYFWHLVRWYTVDEANAKFKAGVKPKMKSE